MPSRALKKQSRIMDGNSRLRHEGDDDNDDRSHRYARRPAGAKALKNRQGSLLEKEDSFDDEEIDEIGSGLDSKSTRRQSESAISSGGRNRLFKQFPKTLDEGGAGLNTDQCQLKEYTHHSPRVAVVGARQGSGIVDRVRRFSMALTSIGRLSKSATMETYITDDSVFTPPGDELVCYMKDNPFRILKCAQNGNSKEVSRILQSDPTRLNARNSQGQMAVHIAALKGHVEVMQTLMDHNADLDAKDTRGNTPLHIAVKANHKDVCALLITNGAKSDVLNNSNMAPIHVAAEEGNVDVIKTLVSNDVNVNLLGEQGQSAMHYAAAKDHGEVMRVLMSLGGKPCLKDDYGFYPIHVAARCAAADAMEAIIEKAISKGYTREDILTFKDRENNMPLHAAVNGGNIKAVMVCLKAGASVRVQQDDGSTPLHFACAQGNMEMITLMKDSQSENFLSAVVTEDAMRMTPLHRAAQFDHSQAVQYLLDHGADLDCKDASGRTPLLLAASKGCWSSVQLLISKNADVHVKDKNNRNFLHLAIRFGGKLEQIGGDFIQDIKDLQNDRDDFGCTPLHYASKEGHLLALDDLIRMGALINPKNNDKQSPFHFAARYGRYNTCRRLLDSVHGPNIINETDGSGLTALHIAAQNGNTKVIQLLLARGAVINRDHEDNTALHHAAANGWTHSMRILVGVRANLIDIPNLHGDTPLHVAAKAGQTSAVSLLLTMGAKLERNVYDLTFMDYVTQNKHHDVAMAAVNHDRWEEVMGMNSKLYGCCFLGLIQQLPDVCMGVLNRCHTFSPDDPRSSEYHVTYNFRYLETPSGCVDAVKNPDSDYTSMLALKKMVENHRVECLSHPVCETFLKAKWAKYGCLIYTVYLTIYALFLACLTSFIVNHNSLMHHEKTTDNKTHNYLFGNKKQGYDFDVPYKFSLLFIIFYSGCNIIKEIIQIIGQRRRYFSDFQNYVEWSLYVSSLLFVTPFMLDRSLHWQWESGAIAVFLAWFNCLVFLQRFDFFGIYVVMFLQILNTLLQVLCVFSILIIAFGMSFFLLLHNEESKAYSTPGLSLLRTFMMMLELDYMQSFNDQYVDGDVKTLHFGTLTLVILTVFVLLMPILLMNLLIGLAVGDIESVQRNARLKRMAMQVQLHADMEAKMPKCLLKRVLVTKHVHYPNKCSGKMAGKFVSMITGTMIDFHTRDTGDTDCQNSFMYEEMYKQKVRMRDMGSLLEKNNALLRKIMQKMEIHTEDDAWDEGTEHDSGDELRPLNANRVNGRSLKRKLKLKSTVLSVWQKSQNK